MLLFGYFFPVIVGILGGFYLQRTGKPIDPWSGFFDPSFLNYLAGALLYWELPLFFVAWLGRPSRIAKPGRATIVLGGFLGTLVPSILLFANLAENGEAIILGTIIIPFLILPGTLLGLAIGWAAAYIRRLPSEPSNPA